MRVVLVIICAVAVACIAFACSRAPQVRFQLAPVKESARFTREVVDKESVTVGDGVTATLILIDGYEPGHTFEDQMETLIKRDIIERKQRAELKASDTLTRGRLAYFIAGALQIKGGLTTRIFGKSQRHSLRECIDSGIIKKGSASSTVSGRELISVLANAESYLVTKGETR